MYKLKKGVVLPLYPVNKHIAFETNIDNTETLCINTAEKNDFEETLEMNDKLFVNMSHELNTPLNIIYSSAQLMELYITNDSIETDKVKIIKCVNSIKQNCFRLRKLVNNLLDLSEIKTGSLNLNLSNENIVEVIENMVQLSAEFLSGMKLNLIFDSNVEEKIIAFDVEKIERVILNLISNAIKFSNPGEKIFINLIDKCETVEISVKDNGIGMEKLFQERIFERFSQVDKSLSRSAEGSGIGLSFVKSIIDMHDGRVSVESKVGEGSVFKFELPNKTLDESNNPFKFTNYNDKIEMISIELSDINNMGWST